MKKKKTSLNDEVMIIMFKVLGLLVIVLILAVSIDIVRLIG